MALNKTPYWICNILSEQGPVQLRSIDSKSLLVQTTLFLMQNTPLDVKGLVDSVCSRWAFISCKLITQYGIITQCMPSPCTLLLADGKVADIITEYAILPVSIGCHNEYCLFFITNLADDTPVIFGLPWLKWHNPYINWMNMSLTFNSWYCTWYCHPPGCSSPTAAPTIPNPPWSFHDLPIPGEPALSN